MRALIADVPNDFYVSAASGWEIAIKAAIGKLTLPDNPQRFVSEQLSLNGFTTLPIHMNHALYVYTLPHHHRDPFDRFRMLGRQSQTDQRAPVYGFLTS